ncbi:hypothetical protein [Micromonospora ureilytica]|uniref:hypothetical protein n=1 Tax=Micromonospora ureilytica TaxID=709868 RepID=UPI00403A4C8B
MVEALLDVGVSADAEPLLNRGELRGEDAVAGEYENFNSYPEAAEVLRRVDGSFDLIRSRQTLDQLVANERIPGDLN